jgi:phosphoenolpyruvate carboxykinase (ATP)
MPIYSNLPLHSSCNIEISNDINPTIFFGLSGTGKTTLSTDSSRGLIGDDEHVWSDDGVFNIESGCYAKCIDLSQKNEPEIFDAIKYGAVLENVVTDNNFVPKYSDRSITDNTRCAYPLSYISNSIIPSITTHPTNIVMLTCDVTGLLPPVAKLDVEQAIYFFLNGYTSKMIGTEVAVTKTEQTFSACFGEPFLVWHPMKYGELLKQKILKHNPNIWLLNTGWITEMIDSTRQTHRISIKNSRNILDALYSGTLIKQEFVTFPLFNFQIPKTCPNINSGILDPRINADSNYMLLLQELYDSFENNYKKLCS